MQGNNSTTFTLTLMLTPPYKTPNFCECDFLFPLHLWGDLGDPGPPGKRVYSHSLLSINILLPLQVFKEEMVGMVQQVYQVSMHIQINSVTCTLPYERVIYIYRCLRSNR